MIRSLRAADLPCALDDSPWYVLSNEVSPTSESFRKNHHHCDNPTILSVTMFSGCFLSLRKHSTTKDFASALFKTKATSWKHGSSRNKRSQNLSTALPAWKKCLNFEFCRPVSEACPTHRDTCGRLAEQNFVNNKVNKTPEGPEGRRREGEISWTPQGRKAHQIKAEI